jgi:rhodanese-related sulfurtransferase
VFIKSIRLIKEIYMEEFDELLRNFDFEYFGTGSHKISFEKVVNLMKKDEVFVLDVRTKEELKWVNLNFSTNIPTHEIPDRLNETPKNKTIAILCVSGTRSTMVSTYLQVNGYKDVKIIPNSLSELTGFIKPGFVRKNLKNVEGGF